MTAHRNHTPLASVERAAERLASLLRCPRLCGATRPCPCRGIVASVVRPYLAETGCPLCAERLEVFFRHEIAARELFARHAAATEQPP